MQHIVYTRHLFFQSQTLNLPPSKTIQITIFGHETTALISSYNPHSNTKKKKPIKHDPLLTRRYGNIVAWRMGKPGDDDAKALEGGGQQVMWAIASCVMSFVIFSYPSL